MKKNYTLLVFSFCLCCIGIQAQERYLSEVFDDTEMQEDVIYGFNTTILPLLQQMPPAKRPLNLDLLMPAGDSLADRPLIIMLPTGNFLPELLNGQIHGSIDDPYFRAMGVRLAKMGYVVALMDYRKGWNPLDPERTARVDQLINATYRGIQDVHTCARFFRKSVAEDGNPFGIDPDKIISWGFGTGGYITLGASTIDNYLELVIDKFIGDDKDGDGNPDPMVIEPINGDPFGMKVGINPLTGDTLCFPNHANLDYQQDFAMNVNLGGALGDTSWIDANDPPMITFQVPTDPFAPYETGIVIVPTTGGQVVEVQGGYTVQQKLKELGNNDVFAGLVDDEYTDAANEANDGADGLFPMRRPNWDLTDDGEDNPIPREASPWEFWDEAFWSTTPWGQAGPLADNCMGAPVELCNWHLVSLGSNPDMSLMKARAYQDTVLNYFAPRACLALGLGNCGTTSTEEVLAQDIVTISPNPVQNELIIKTDGKTIDNIEVYDVQGRLVRKVNEVNNSSFVMNRDGIQTGMHILQIRMEEGVVSKRVMFH